MLHIRGTQEAVSWHIGYNIHYVMHGYNIHLLHREDQARHSLSAKLHVLSFFRTQQEAWGLGYASDCWGTSGSCWGTCPSVP